MLSWPAVEEFDKIVFHYMKRRIFNNFWSSSSGKQLEFGALSLTYGDQDVSMATSVGIVGIDDIGLITLIW